jgi:hypothetical protein
LPLTVPSAENAGRHDQKGFDEYAGATGTIVVLDGRTRKVTASIGGSRDFAPYRAAIDATLKGGTCVP